MCRNNSGTVQEAGLCSYHTGRWLLCRPHVQPEVRSRATNYRSGTRGLYLRQRHHLGLTRVAAVAAVAVEVRAAVESKGVIVASGSAAPPPRPPSSLFAVGASLHGFGSDVVAVRRVAAEAALVLRPAAAVGT